MPAGIVKLDTTLTVNNYYIKRSTKKGETFYKIYCSEGPVSDFVKLIHKIWGKIFSIQYSYGAEINTVISNKHKNAYVYNTALSNKQYKKARELFPAYKDLKTATEEKGDLHHHRDLDNDGLDD